MKLKYKFLFSAAAILLPVLLLAQEERITITTYYPSPYGSYAELRADKAAIGSGYRGAAINIPDNGLIVEGNVGIGTSNPAAKLHVDGAVTIGSSGSSYTLPATRGSAGQTLTATDSTGTVAWSQGSDEFWRWVNPSHWRMVNTNSGREVEVDGKLIVGNPNVCVSGFELCAKNAFVEKKLKASLCVSGPYQVWQGIKPRQPMVLISQGFCFLTKVTGKFEGGAEVVEIIKEGGRWVLVVRSNQGGVAAEAYCAGIDGC